MGDVHEKNSTTGEWGVRSSTQTTDSSGNPAGNVVVDKISGAYSSHVMSPTNNFTGTAPAENYQDATGCKKFWVDLGAIALDASEVLIVSWSTFANDTVTTQGACNQAATAFGTPDGVAQDNVAIISNNTLEQLYVEYDGETTIKTISMRTDAAPSATLKPILNTVA